MQHHHAPTRLLDWTENILVALYFATGSPTQQPGELWCIDPSKLNEISNCRVCGPEDPRVAYLAAEVFLESKKLPHLKKTLELEDTPLWPIAFVPAFEFPRIESAVKSVYHPPI